MDLVPNWGNADPEALIRRFWQRMSHIYPSFARDYGEDPATGAGEEWAMMLAELTREQIKAGVDACARGEGPKRGFAPSIPEFRVLALGIPSRARTRVELDESSKDQKFVRSSFVILVYSKIDWYAWGRATSAEQRAMLNEVYEECVEHVILGRPMPRPAGPAITHQPAAEEAKEHDPEVAKAAMEAMKAELGW